MKLKLENKIEDKIKNYLFYINYLNLNSGNK